MIIVEGMDNTGKSTLVHKMKGLFNLKDYKSPGADISQDERKTWVLNRLYDENKFVIYDRFPLISEPIYGTIIRKHNQLEDAVNLYRLFKERQPLIIYCRPNRHVILSFEDGREQMTGVKPNAEKLLEAYDTLFDTMSQEQVYPVVLYNYLDPEDDDAVFMAISKYLEL